MRPSTMTTVWWGIKRSASIGTELTSTTALGHYRRGTASGLVKEFSRRIGPTCSAKSTASALSPAANNPEKNGSWLREAAASRNGNTFRGRARWIPDELIRGV